MTERCGCGLEDCELLDFDYPYCTGCGEHHRAPVAGETKDPWCPVDFRMAVLAEEDKLPADAPVDFDAVAARVREQFTATLR